VKEEHAREAGDAEEEQIGPGAPEQVTEARLPDEGKQAEEVLVEEQAADELDALRQELEEARAKEAEYLDGWQRAMAELANARKRFQREQEHSYTNAKAGVLASLLPIVDDVERALDTVPEALSNEPWFEGLTLILRKQQRFLEQEGAEPIETAGQEFDPFLHEAVTHEPSETVPQGHVIAELHKGYKVGDRVLRPSMVRVSSGPLSVPEPPLEEPAADDE